MPEMMHGFTEAERAEFLRLIGRLRKLDESGGIPSEDVHTTASPGTLVALIPVGGLPPLTRGPNGTPARPGSALCQIYEPRYSLSLARYELVKVEGYFETVLNVSPAWVDPGYAVINRENYGSWVYECPCIETTGTGSTGTSTYPTGTGTETGTSTSTTGTATTGTSTDTSCCGRASDCGGYDVSVERCGGTCTWRWNGSPNWSLDSYDCADGSCGCCAPTPQQFLDATGRPVPFIDEIWVTCCCIYTP